MVDKKLSNNIITATKWSFITNLMRKMITPVTNMILARLLTPDAFGVVATINIVISFSELFSDAGFQKYLVQHEFDNDKDLYKTATVAFWTNFCVSVILWLFIAIFRDSIASMVGSEGYGFHLIIASLAIPFAALSSIQQAIYKRAFDFKGLFFPRFINSIVPIFVTIPLAYLYRNCWALIVGTLVGGIGDAVILTLKSRWKPRLYYNFQDLTKMFSFSFWTLLESLSIWLTINIDIFILGSVLSNYYIGVYKVSITTVDQITTVITTTIVPVFFSALSRCQGDEKNFKSMFYSFQNKAAILLIPLSFGMFIFGDFITTFLLGEKWAEAIQFISMLGLVQGFIVIFANFASEVYRSKGEPRISFFVQSCYVFTVIPFLIMASKERFATLCLYRVLMSVYFISIHITMLCCRYRFNIFELFMNIKSAFVASLLMSLVGLYLNRIADNMPFKFLSIITCIIVYFLSCMVFKDTRATIKSMCFKVKSIVVK